MTAYRLGLGKAESPPYPLILSLSKDEPPNGKGGSTSSP